MKKLIILSILLLTLTFCTKPKPKQNIVSEAEPSGFIDSLSHIECIDLPKPEKND